MVSPVEAGVDVAVAVPQAEEAVVVGCSEAPERLDYSAALPFGDGPYPGGGSHGGTRPVDISERARGKGPAQPRRTGSGYPHTSPSGSRPHGLRQLLDCHYRRTLSVSPPELLNARCRLDHISSALERSLVSTPDCYWHVSKPSSSRSLSATSCSAAGMHPVNSLPERYSSARSGRSINSVGIMPLS